MELCDFQIYDPSNNLIMPWLTHGALAEINSWNLSDKKVLEYGAGYSTLWWASKCNEVFSVEANKEWFDRINQEWHELISAKPEKHIKAVGKIHMVLRQVNEGDQLKIEYYTNIPDWFKPDIVIVDSILRYECILKALTFTRPLTLIVDNWQQDYVFRCPAAEEALRGFKGQIYVQPDHTNHEGNPWKTGIWKII